MEPTNASNSSGNPSTQKVNPVQTTNPTVGQKTQPIKSSETAQTQTVKPAVPLQSKPILKPMTTAIPTKKPAKKSNRLLITVATLLTIVLGIVSGYELYAVGGGGKVDPKTGLTQETGLQREVASTEIKVGTKVGVADERTFKDNAEGQLEKGGMDGEGSHHLVRPGGASQTLYITSSIIDLDQFVGRKVKVWGETLGAQKAGWLMDVGKLEVLE